MENKPRYTKSFIEFDKVSTSKDGKKIIIHVAQKLMVSLNVAYLQAIIKNLENPSQDVSADDFLPQNSDKNEVA
jgi:hypothetical protein